MPPAYAILLDGGFVRRKLGGSRAPAGAGEICALTEWLSVLPCTAGMRLHRIYFYDAKPLEEIARIPLSDEIIDFGSSAAAFHNRQIQSALIQRPFYALRFGELLHEGWRLRRRVLQKQGPRIEIGSDDIEPSIRQKGVDMRIGLDIASLTLKKQVQLIVLVTADSDFVPAMKFARREGAQLVLVTLGHGIRPGLREHADLVVDELPPTLFVPFATLP